MSQSWLLARDSDRADLVTFLSRAKRADDDGLARLVARDGLLAVYVCPLHGGGGPTVMGLRVFRLAEAADDDVVVPLDALLDRLARAENGLRLPVPPMQTVAPWAGVTPPRSGWELVGEAEAAGLDKVARSGITEVAGLAEAGAADLPARRSHIWTQPVLMADEQRPAGQFEFPAGIAFVAAVLGLLTDPITLHTIGPWTRLTSPAGYVIGRLPALRTSAL